MAYDNPAGLAAAFAVFEVLACTSVLLRFMSRRKMRAGLGADDWLILCALLLGTGMFIVEIYGISMEAFGTARDKGHIDPWVRYYMALKLQYVFVILNVVAITLIKLSAVFLFRRLFTTNATFRKLSLVWIIVLMAWGISFCLWCLLQCGTHLSAYFGAYDDYEKYCSSSGSAAYVLVFTDLFTDLVTLLMPIPMVLRLQTSLRRKIAIATFFAIGTFTVVASAMRAAEFVIAQSDTSQGVLKMTTKISVWTYLEVMVGICATCAITLRPIFANVDLNFHRLSWTSIRERRLSSVFSKRSSTDSKASDAQNIKEKLGHGVRVQARSINTESSEFSEVESKMHEPGHITIEQSYTVSVCNEEDIEARNAEGQQIAPFFCRV